MSNRNFKTRIISVFAALLIVSGVDAQTTFNYTGTTQTHIVPAGVFCVRIQAWGAGGGGAGGGESGASNRDGGGGAGGGGYAESYILVNPGDNLDVIVGQGGTAGANQASGSNGELSSVSFNAGALLVLANGGALGDWSGNNGNAGGNPGLGGGGNIGQISFSGGTGGAGLDNNTGRGGGGGSSASPTSNGTPGGTGIATGPSAGPGVGGIIAGGGNGGDGGSAVGVAGTVPGGGGGGGSEAAGGNGAHGRVIITNSAVVCPTSSSITPAGTTNECISIGAGTLTATAVSLPGCKPSLEYQWYSQASNSNNVGTATAIAGATTDTYTPPTPTGGTYYYFCVVYATSCAQTATTQSQASNVAEIVVADPCSIDATHPIIGINGEYVGACLVANCGPINYYDDGGPTGNYSPSINNIYRTFCPSTAGSCMSVTFNNVTMANTLDYLAVKNGPTQNSPDMTTNAATGNTFTSTDASGCLTFRFNSTSVNEAAGWDATITCTPCAGGPSGTDNNDCNTLTPLCVNAAVPGNSSGPGIIAEGCNGTDCPAGGENHTNWFLVQAATSGTIEMTLTPNTASDDYDFAVYGPNASCASLGTALRCSDSGMTGATGFINGEPDLTESVTGNKFVDAIDAIAGETYIIVVDEWSPAATTGVGYSLDFSSSTANLDCAVLPVELEEFKAEYVPSENFVDLNWVTSSERDCDFWDIERSTDGINFEIIHTMNGAGTTTNETRYYTIDNDPFHGVNYYRLNQFDKNGNAKYSEVRAVNILSDYYDMITTFPNPTNGLTEVIYNSYTKEEVSVNVVDSRGATIVDTKIDAIPGGNRFDLDLSDYNKGVYFITIITRDKAFHSKLVRK